VLRHRRPRSTTEGVGETRVRASPVRALRTKVKKRERRFPYLAAAEESAGGSKPGLSPTPSVF
jgi:hypothetical protein